MTVCAYFAPSCAYLALLCAFVCFLVLVDKPARVCCARTGHLCARALLLPARAFPTLARVLCLAFGRHIMVSSPTP